MGRDQIEKGGKVDDAAAAGIMVIVRSAIVMKVDMAALPGGKERVEVPIQPGMAAVEDKTQAAGTQFGKEGRGPEMAAFPRTHVLDTGKDPVLLLEPEEIVKRTEQGGKRPVTDLLIRGISRVDYKVPCADSSTGCHHVAEYSKRGLSHTLVDRGDVDLACGRMDGI